MPGLILIVCYCLVTAENSEVFGHYFSPRFRHVSKDWDSTAMEILKKRPLWIKRQWNLRPLRDLYNCMRESTNFPFCRLDLREVFIRRDAYDEFANLFRRLRPYFTHLRVDLTSNGSAEILQRFSSTTSSNVQYLEFRNYGWSRNTVEIQEARLSSLRILKLDGCKRKGNARELEVIIRAAPNSQKSKMFTARTRCK